MNLLSAPWLPFRHRDDSILYRPPAAIADPEVIDLAFPRADFQGAAYQWLIGLLQTALSPEDGMDWTERFEALPTEDELKDAFAPFAGAFALDGDGPRFMQDLDPLEQTAPSTVAALLIEAPGESTRKKNIDHFIKRGIADEICRDCTAIALFTMQISAPAGGAGVRVGLRGGGPLTTLILPDDPEASLWHKLWLNVLPPARITADGQAHTAPKADDAAIFPWMGPTRVSDKPGTEVLPGDVHPLHAYWAMPRRFRLLVEDSPCRCQLCGRQAEHRISEIRAKNYGANYDGAWRHPLTPYRCNPKKPQELPYSRKPQDDGLGYRHWAGFVLDDASDSGALPAAVVVDYLSDKVRINREDLQSGMAVERLLLPVRLWAFGYDMDNMKARGWYSLEMPLVAVPAEQQERLREWVKNFVGLAQEAAGKLRDQVKMAWFKRPQDAKGDLGYLDKQFYEATQADFFRVLRRLGEVLRDGGVEALVPAEAARDWYLALRRQALRLFDAHALSGPMEDMDMKRLVRARQFLLFWFLGGGKGRNSVAHFADRGGFDLRPLQHPVDDKEKAHE
ncbi:type I-E CRISPR-associated protein Cse1/CasA [Halomonas sp. YLGW01]|uniref:type I-E CRISPR-associated protein Cse1/CasA n=1 Tax=Halomonas sp. YLGW01 TaxID=2773308 RepID=UPI0017838780|nr:type I-E CRISPR-associated protein Cse1/CasA [Halomonas sp. YLGW01]